MWNDLQQTFFITLGPFIQNILLPVFIAAGVLLALLMPLARFWKPTEKIKLDPGWERDRD
ncbi:MAG: hypothetical protein HC875_17000 [Anaerolineales bacterium]|nr:hypothetical protein [Anaerolineales bacterium]